MATMIAGHKAVLDTKLLDKITAEIKPKAKKIVNEYGQAIATEAATVHPWKLDTGALTNSILAESKMTDDLTFTVQDGVEYGVFLELGTSKMAAYPFFVPAIEKYASKFITAFTGLFK